MNEIAQNKLTALAKIVDYPNDDLANLRIALTHRSVGLPHNERLEFLGDSVLNIVISEELYQRFPLADEGALTRIRAQLVRGDTLANIAKEKDIGNYLNLGPGEIKSGGHQRNSILADSLEAIIGAIYCDSDLATVRRIILVWFESLLNKKPPQNNNMAIKE